MRVRLPGLYIVLCLVLAGLIHIMAVLTLPLLAPRNAQARLAELGPANTMIQLPASVPGRQVMPMMAPDVRYAMCRYDLSNGPVRLRAAVAEVVMAVVAVVAAATNELCPDNSKTALLAGAVVVSCQAYARISKNVWCDLTNQGARQHQFP